MAARLGSPPRIRRKKSRSNVYWAFITSRLDILVLPFRRSSKNDGDFPNLPATSLAQEEHLD